jgi:hypothetical protein
MVVRTSIGALTKIIDYGGRRPQFEELFWGFTNRRVARTHYHLDLLLTALTAELPT